MMTKQSNTKLSFTQLLVQSYTSGKITSTSDLEHFITTYKVAEPVAEYGKEPAKEIEMEVAR